MYYTRLVITHGPAWLTETVQFTSSLHETHEQAETLGKEDCSTQAWIYMSLGNLRSAQYTIESIDV